MFREKYAVMFAAGDSFNEIEATDFKEIGVIKARTVDGAIKKANRLIKKVRPFTNGFCHLVPCDKGRGGE